MERCHGVVFSLCYWPLDTWHLNTLWDLLHLLFPSVSHGRLLNVLSQWDKICIWVDECCHRVVFFCCYYNVAIGYLTHGHSLMLVALVNSKLLWSWTLTECLESVGQNLHLSGWMLSRRSLLSLLLAVSVRQTPGHSLRLVALVNSKASLLGTYLMFGVSGIKFTFEWMSSFDVIS